MEKMVVVSLYMWKNKVVTDVMVVIRIVFRVMNVMVMMKMVMMVVVMVMMKMVVMVPSVKARMTNDGDPGDWLALAPASAVYLLLLDPCKQISIFAKFQFCICIKVRKTNN